MDYLWDKYTRNSRGWANDLMAKAHPRIYIGSCADVNEMTFTKLGITHAVNCAGEEWSSKWFKNAFPDRYECIGAEDSLEFDITSMYPKFESIMNRFLADPESKNIYVHCQCGINRSAFLLLIYVCVKFRYDMESVVKNVLIQRPCCFRNPVFRQQVTAYIKKLE